MNILLCIYSLMLCMLAVFAYKNELGISITSIILVVLLTLFAGIHLSLKEVHISHHIIRLLLHLVLIFNLWVF